jgi:hypothetical protein
MILPCLLRPACKKPNIKEVPMKKKDFAGLVTEYDYLWFALGSMLFYSFFLLQGDHLIDIDMYFHIKLASLLKEQIVVAKLPWMAMATHADHYVDYHFLYHWLMVPFTFFTNDLILAAKWAMVFFAGFSIGALAFLLKNLKVPYRWFWVLFYLLASPIFTGRLLFGRAVILFIGILYLFIYSLINGKYKLTAIISFLAVWTYQGFPLLGVVAFIYTIACLFRNETNALKGLLATGLGLVAGFIIHPSFPQQFYGYWLELGVHAAGAPGLELISEWLPMDRALIQLAFFLPLLLLSLSFLHNHPQTPLGSVLLVLVIALILGVAVSLKPYEYFIPVLTVYLALQKWEELPAYLYRLLGVLCLVGMLAINLPQLYQRMLKQFPLTSPRAEFDAATWLKANTPDMSLVMLPWSEFPEFFFKNTHNRFLFGLNPVYAYGKDKETYFLIRRFFEGRGEDLQLIPSLLQAPYVVLHKQEQNPTWRFLLNKREAYTSVYENEKFLILHFTAPASP